MNYIKQDLAFEEWCENDYLPIFSQMIWRKLFKRFNRCGWCEWVTVDNLTLMAETQIKSEATFITYRDKLIEKGFIEYKKGGKMSPNQYKMVQLYEDDEELTSLNEVNNEENLKSKSGKNCSQKSKNVKVKIDKSSYIYNKHKGKPKQDNSSEPETGSLPADKNSDIFISFLLNDGTEYDVTVEKVKYYAGLYPAVNIEQELREITGWCFANKSKRKTRSGAESFINRWLAKTQNKGGSQNGSNGGNTGKGDTKPADGKTDDMAAETSYGIVV